LFFPPSPRQRLAAPSLADFDKTLAVAEAQKNRATTGFTVHRKLGRKLGRSVALLWHADLAVPADATERAA